MIYYILPAEMYSHALAALERIRASKHMHTAMDNESAALGNLAFAKRKADLIPGHRYGTFCYSLGANAWREGKLLCHHSEVYIVLWEYQPDGTFINRNAWGGYTQKSNIGPLLFELP